MKRFGQHRKCTPGSQHSVVSAARTIFLGLLAAAALGSACTRSGASSTLTDVCEMEEGSFVAVEGFLQLPNFLETNSQGQTTMYELSLAALPDSKTPSITTRITGTSEKERNRIANLPLDGYTQSDLRIFTASGETVGAFDRVRVSGELKKERVNGGQPCILISEMIEKR